MSDGRGEFHNLFFGSANFAMLENCRLDLASEHMGTTVTDAKGVMMDHMESVASILSIAVGSDNPPSDKLVQNLAWTMAEMAALTQTLDTIERLADEAKGRAEL